MGPRSAASVLAAALLVAGWAGCGGDDDGGQAAGTTTTTEATTTTTTEEPSTTSTSAEPEDCGAPAPVPGVSASDISQRPVDADGDGEPDDAYAYLDGGTPTVAVRLEDGTTAVTPAGEPAGSVLEVLGGHDLGDGDTVFVRVGSGASVDVIGLFELAGCQLARVTVAGGQPVALAVGGTVTHADGARCTDGDDGPELEVLSATSVDGETFVTDDRTYRLNGTELVEVASSSVTLTAPADGERIEAHYRLDCPGVA